ncbi:hypothetical protein Syun_013928 [Stephania yunnanensis]|uniref:Uncharacterized protein n=1 Tax=Stephania yunnanensis TaxID=152371 RepID=A0AAP0JK23_9MAGN
MEPMNSTNRDSEIERSKPDIRVPNSISLKRAKTDPDGQDFMEFESPTTSISVSSSDHISRSSYVTLKELVGSGVTDAENIVQELVLKYMKNVRFEKKSTSIKKWIVMKLRVDGYDASLCKTKTSWITKESFQGGDYEYIDIMLKRDTEKGSNGGGGDSMRLIVDIDFKSQFELARPTTTYKNLLRPLPSIFVGSEEKVLKIVSLLCSAAKESLKESGLHIPPWRKTTYMQSKWLSQHCQKEQISTAAAAAATTTTSSAVTSLCNKWSPPTVKINPKRRDWGSGSALTSQISNMSINCC